MLRERLSADKQSKELIHCYIFNPATHLFKQPANTKAECRLLFCNNKSNCAVHARGECIMIGGLFGGSCPYGSRRTDIGPTRRARSFSTWIRTKQAFYKETPFLDNPTTKLAIIGDYVYLPYSFMSMNKNVPFVSHSSFMSQGIPLVPLGDFKTKEIIDSILSFRPQALMGGEIKDYQKDSVPKFKMHLLECVPEIYEEFIGEPVKDISYVGRKAYISSLKDGVTIQAERGNGDYLIKDGWLVSTNAKIFLSFVRYDEVELRLKPKLDQVVTITDNTQVDADTKFKD